MFNKVMFKITVNKGRDEKGAMSIVMLFVITFFIIMGAFAVDISRFALLDGQLSLATVNSTIIDKAALSNNNKQRENVIRDVLKFSMAEINKGKNVKSTEVKITGNSLRTNNIQVSITPDLLILDKFLTNLKPSVDTAYGKAATKFHAMEIVLVVDVSGSMGGDMPTLKNTIKQFIDYLNNMRQKRLVPYLNVGIVAFNHNSHVIMNGQCYKASTGLVIGNNVDAKDGQYTLEINRGGTWSFGNTCNYFNPLTSNYNVLKTKVDSFNALGGTNGAAGLYWAGKMLSPSWSPEFGVNISNYNNKVKKQVIFFSDGLMRLLRNQVVSACNSIKSRKTELYAIGIGGADKRMMGQCATSRKHSLYSNSVNGLKTIFNIIYRRMLQNITLTR